MRTLREEQRAKDGAKYLSVVLICDNSKPKKVGRMWARIFPGSGHLEILRLDASGTAMINTLVTLLKAAESEAFAHKCSTIYSPVFGTEQDCAFQKMGYKPNSFSIVSAAAPTNADGPPWVTKEAKEIHPLLLSVYTGNRITRHVGFVRTSNLHRNTDSHPA